MYMKPVVVYFCLKKNRINANVITEEEVKSTNCKADVTRLAKRLEDLKEFTLKFFKSGKEVIGKQKMVAVLPCKWRSIANGWIKRERNNDWLDSSLINDIVKQWYQSHTLFLPIQMINGVSLLLLLK